jgi:hypothetical protein
VGPSGKVFAVDIDQGPIDHLNEQVNERVNERAKDASLRNLEAVLAAPWFSPLMIRC